MSSAHRVRIYFTFFFCSVPSPKPPPQKKKINNWHAHTKSHQRRKTNAHTPEPKKRINTEKIPTRILDKTKWGRKACGRLKGVVVVVVGDGRTDGQRTDEKESLYIGGMNSYRVHTHTREYKSAFLLLPPHCPWSPWIASRDLSILFCSSSSSSFFYHPTHHPPRLIPSTAAHASWRNPIRCEREVGEGGVFGGREQRGRQAGEAGRSVNKMQGLGKQEPNGKV